MPRLRKIKGRYYAYFYDPGKRPKEKSIPLRTTRRDAAQRKLRRLENDYAEGIIDPWSSIDLPRNVTLSDAISVFLEKRASELRPKTLEAYGDVLRNWTKTMPVSIWLHTISVEHVRSYLRDERVRPATRLKRYRHLKSFFNWCVTNGLCFSNPLATEKPPKVGRSVPQYLTATELERLLLAIDADAEMRTNAGGRTPDVTWLKDLIVLAVSTGMRLGELLSLRWSAVDLDNRKLIVRNTASFRTKSGNERRVSLAQSALTLLTQRYLQRSPSMNDLVILTRAGNPIRVTYASSRFKHYVRLAKLADHIHFHSLRHTCASWLVMNGESLSVVQAILGHSTITVTQQYAHLAPEIIQRAVDKTFAELPSG